ncbi:hypothetical protein [Rubrivirga sp. IMCC45206]|uniref:hypothetical protein n=1 Tax=Rubrivirga sp. IMCC45206 TaxID=3391614 RepID=UPI00398FBDA9
MTDAPPPPGASRETSEPLVPEATAPTPGATAAPGPPAAPPLSGWRLRLAWAGLALLVVWGVALNVQGMPVYRATYGEAIDAAAPLHIDIDFRNGGVRVRPQSGGVAEQAGLPEGRLLAVGDRPVAGDDTYFDAAALLRATPGDAVRLTVAALEGDTVAVVVPRTDALSPEIANMGMDVGTYEGIINGIVVLVCLGFLIGAVVLVLRRSRGGVALLGAATFAGFGFTMPFQEWGRWALPTADGVALGALATSGWGFDFVVGGVMIAFLMVFPDGRVRPRWAWAAMALHVVGFWPLLHVRLFVSDPAVLSAAAVARPLQVTLLLGVLVAAQAVRYRRQPPGVGRQQTKWATLGVTVGLACFGALIVISAWPVEVRTVGYWRTILAANGLALGLVFWPIGVVASLTRYRLWDAESAWSRSATAGALTLALTAIIAGGTALVQSVLGATGPLALGLATAAAAVFFVPLQTRLGAWADHRFLRDLQDLKTGLPDLVGHLRETESVEGIAEAVTDRVAPVVHATHAALVVPEGEGWEAVGAEGITREAATGWASSAGLSTPPDLAATRRQPWREVVWREATDRRFPVRVALRAERGGGEIATEGWLLLGPRPDGSGYGPDDLEAVAEIAGPVGRALQVVRVRESRARARRADRDRITETLDALRADLQGLRAARSS